MRTSIRVRFFKSGKAFAVIVWSLLTALSAFGGDNVATEHYEDVTNHQWALLIGPQDYQHVSKLQCSSHDCEQLALALTEHCGIPADHIVQVVDTNGPTATRDRMMQEISAFLAERSAEDSVLIYFTGQGFRTSAGVLALGAVDTHPEQMEQTCVTMDWIYAFLATCPARAKVVALDTCHAAASACSANRLGVITLASSASDEVSYELPARRHGLFTYWLISALAGDADINRDQQLDANELGDYLAGNVSRNAQQILQRPQTPVVINDSGESLPVVFQLVSHGAR